MVARTCPHCRAALPAIGDAFCSQCGQALEESPPERSPRTVQNAGVSWGNPRRYTFLGRLIILIYVLLGFAGTGALIAYVIGSLPPGRYPVFYFVAPFLILGVLLCANTFHLLEKWGVKIYADSPDSGLRKSPPNL